MINNVILLIHKFNHLQAPASPTSSRKEKGSPSHARRSTSSSKLSSSNVSSGCTTNGNGSSSSSSGGSSSKNKNLPQSFGYMKRANGTPESAQTKSIIPTGRTVHASAVQRSNKMKVSGGTQTCSDPQKRI